MGLRFRVQGILGFGSVGFGFTDIYIYVYIISLFKIAGVYFGGQGA